jgi:predicted O-methyltransferase YrrM
VDFWRGTDLTGETKKMLKEIRLFAKRFFSKYRSPNVSVKWIRKDSHSWLWQYLKDDFIKPKQTTYSPRIATLAKETNQLGPQPLWDGYANNNIAGPTRMPDAVRTAKDMGNLYTYLVQKLQPDVVVEFGTAFGISGMYFLAGIESNHKGKLLTFEPNDMWRHLAIRNLSQISDRFDSIGGVFEEHIDDVLPQGQGIDLAFIDAIHTKEFVVPQLEMVIARSSDHAIIILDDINFSDSMRECWEEVSKDSRFMCSAALGERVGILELNRSRKD